MHTRISWTLLSKSGTTPILRSMQTWLTLRILSLTMQWQYTQEIINQIKNMFRTRWAAATQESKQRFKPLLNEPCPPRYSEQQDSLRCYLDPNDLIRDNRKMGYEIRQLPAFFILQTYSRDFQKHLLRNPGPAPLCRFMVHDDDVLDYVDQGELLRKFHDFEVRNFTVEFTSLFLLRTFGPFFRGRCSVRTSSLRRCLKIPPRTTSAAALWSKRFSGQYRFTLAVF